MKKAFFKLMLLVLGLNVFTACYGPAPGGDWNLPEDPEQTEVTDADGDGVPDNEESDENAN